MSRPVSVWVLTIVTLLIALVGLLGGLGAYADAVDHGDEDAVPLSLARVAVAAALLMCAVGVFVGARWGRTGIATVCVLNFVGVVGGALNDAISGFAVFLALGVSIVLGFWALGPQVDTWTGGDP
jgi:hypothetical protein